MSLEHLFESFGFGIHPGAGDPILIIIGCTKMTLRPRSSAADAAPTPFEISSLHRLIETSVFGLSSTFSSSHRRSHHQKRTGDSSAVLGWHELKPSEPTRDDKLATYAASWAPPQTVGRQRDELIAYTA